MPRSKRRTATATADSKDAHNRHLSGLFSTFPNIQTTQTETAVNTYPPDQRTHVCTYTHTPHLHDRDQVRELGGAVLAVAAEEPQRPVRLEVDLRPNAVVPAGGGREGGRRLSGECKTASQGWVFDGVGSK